MQCIACNSNKFQEYSDTSYLNIPSYQCEECNLIVTGETINEINEAISSIYSNKFWDEQKEIFGNIDDTFSDTISQGKQRNFISQFKFSKPYFNNRKTVLEIGSGTGHTIFWLDQKGYQVTGIEPDLQNVSMINPKLKNSKILHCFIDDFDNVEKYEIIWMSHVFEHLSEPEIFLEKIKKNMSEDSIFFLEIPNCEHPSTLKDSIFGSPHVYHFTSKSIRKLCEKHGFEIISSMVFRPASKIEGAINKLSNNKFPYYPRIECNPTEGRDLRVLFKIKS